MFHMLRTYALGAAAALAFAVVLAEAPASAQDQPKTVIELYTSQGCSSCPPADKLLGKLARQPDLVALTFPVDYWDYLGWKDTLASPANSARQRSYARARGDGQVYTPQMVIDGIYHAVGSHAADVRHSVLKARKKLKDERVSLSLSTEGDTLVITAGEAPPGSHAKPATIWLALIKSSETVKINRGENRGKTITYHQVVRHMTPVGQWNGQEVTVRLPKQHLQNGGSDGCAVLLQQDMAGPVLAAAEMKKW